MLSSWSKLYKVFARCSALVATAEENIGCEELCTKMNTVINKEALLVCMSEQSYCWFEGSLSQIVMLSVPPGSFNTEQYHHYPAGHDRVCGLFSLFSSVSAKA